MPHPTLVDFYALIFDGWSVRGEFPLKEVSFTWHGRSG